ncbi:SDR family NAD(P)-dependent oxidoreductase [Moorella sulfitireducens]|uniref:SDR family NAD(P)-dependent oxidoreductase n=1 Tax=Neomoorella sulfitireducens TaxID=2972948 RepID=UPI0021AD1EFA|nr:glucose 1-dehydrogenase [Moorella sulfitireducens]
MEDIFSLKGKNAIVIGGAGGIGQAIAKGLAFYGAGVGIASRNLENLKRAAEEIKNEIGKDIKYFQVDSGEEKSIQELVAKVVAEMGTVHILVNSQGYNVKYPALEFPMEEWDNVFKVNVRGVMICCKEFAKLMAQQKYGKIINISSVRGARACGGGNTAYGASKGALDMMTRMLAVELAPYNITVNAIGPALTETKMVADLIRKDPAGKEKYIGNIPLKRIGLPEDVIGAAVYLASPASDFVTGQVLYPDGGLTAVG